MRIWPLPIHIYTTGRLDAYILEKQKDAAIMTRRQTNSQMGNILAENAKLREQIGGKKRYRHSR